MSRTAVIGAMAAAGIVLTAAGGWQYHTTTPHYALQKAREAVERQDGPAFERRVDLDAVSRSMIDEFFALAIAEGGAGDGERAALEASVGAALLEGIKPPLAAALAGAIRTSVEEREASRLELLGETLALDEVARELGLAAGMFEGIAAVHRQGDTATAGLRFRDPLLDTTLILDVQLEREADGWTLKRLTGLDAYLRDVRALQLAVLTTANARLEREVQDRVRIGPVRVSKPGTSWTRESMRIGVTIRNRGPDTLRLVSLSVGQPASWRPEWGRFPALSLLHADPLPPGDSARVTTSLRLDPFDDGHLHLRTGPRLEASVDRIGVRQEAMIRRYDSWSEYMADGGGASRQR